MIRRFRGNTLFNQNKDNKSSNTLSSYENPNKNPISYLHQRIDEMFNEIISNFGGVSNLNSFFEKNMPHIDVQERPHEYIVQAQLPGLDVNDIKLEIVNNTLHLVAGQKQKQENKDGYVSSVYYVEKSFALPNDAEEHKIDAEMKNGVLTIIIPRNPDILARKININNR